jgi:hypothetical protein
MKSITRYSRVLSLSATMLAVTLMSCPAQAQRSTRGESYGGSAPDSKEIAPGIAWFGVLRDGLDEAERTGRPILFLTAAPQCNGIPGMW